MDAILGGIELSSTNLENAFCSLRPIFDKVQEKSKDQIDLMWGEQILAVLKAWLTARKKDLKEEEKVAYDFDELFEEHKKGNLKPEDYLPLCFVDDTDVAGLKLSRKMGGEDIDLSKVKNADKIIWVD